MIIFGGLHFYNSLSDTFVFNIERSEWKRMVTSGSNSPPNMRKHTAVLTADEKKMLVFGGVDDNGKLHNSLYVLDLASRQWTLEKPTGQIPVPRIGHTAEMIPGNKMVIFGGNSDRSMLNDVYIYDIGKKQWTKMNPRGDIPIARTGGVGTIIGNNLYIFGGIKYYGDIYGYINDIHRYDYVNNNWELIDDQHKIAPRASFCAVTSAGGNYLLLHGYWELYQDDSIIFNTNTDTWLTLDDSSSPTIPLGRSHASAITINSGDTTKVYFFAGNDGIMGPDLGFKNDIWIAEGSGF